MSQLNLFQRRQIIESALALLDQDSLDFNPGTGLTMRQEIRGVIENTLGDDCSPGAVGFLLCRMVQQTIAEMGALGFEVGEFDFRDYLTRE